MILALMIDRYSTFIVILITCFIVIVIVSLPLGLLGSRVGYLSDRHTTIAQISSTSNGSCIVIAATLDVID